MSATSWVFDGRTDSIDRLISEVTASHRRCEGLAALAATAGRPRPTALPGWTTTHLLCHLERNAASHIRMLEGAVRGQAVEQYMGGNAERSAEIEEGSSLPIDTLVAALVATNRALEDVWLRVDETSWRRPTWARAGVRPAFTCLWARWREVEIHSVDLAVGATVDDWPTTFAAAGLDVSFQGLELRAVAERLPEAVRLDLTDPSGRTWSSHPGSAPTHTGSGASPRLLGWVVSRCDAAAIEWMPHSPTISPWP